MDAVEFKRYASATTLIQFALVALSAAFVALAGWIVTETGNDTAGPALFALWSAFLWWQLQEYIRRLMYTRGDVFNAVLNTATLQCHPAGISLLVGSASKPDRHRRLASH